MQKAFSTIPNNRQIVDIMSDRRKGWLAALEPEGRCGENINQACPRAGGNQAGKQASPSWMGSDSSWLSPSDAHTPRGKRSQHAAPAPGDPDLERPGRQSTANLHTWLPQSSPRLYQPEAGEILWKRTSWSLSSKTTSRICGLTCCSHTCKMCTDAAGHSDPKP